MVRVNVIFMCYQMDMLKMRPLESASLYLWFMSDLVIQFFLDIVFLMPNKMSVGDCVKIIWSGKGSKVRQNVICGWSFLGGEPVFCSLIKTLHDISLEKALNLNYLLFLNETIGGRCWNFPLTTQSLFVLKKVNHKIKWSLNTFNKFLHHSI